MQKSSLLNILLAPTFIIVSLCASPLWAQVNGDLSLLQNVVLNGDPVSNADDLSRFTVSVEIEGAYSNGPGYCTGVVIAPNFILTAGHCFEKDGLKANVRFGVGGGAGYQQVPAIGYRWVYNKNPIGASVSTQAADQPMISNYKKQFLELSAQLTEWISYPSIYDKYITDKAFQDIAIIRIAGLPNGYHAIPFYGKEPAFKSRGIVLGYGGNMFSKSLKSTEVQLIGKCAYKGKSTLGWESYSDIGHNPCGGDSGGPLAVLDQGQLKLLGITVFQTNNCQAGTWHMNPLNYSKWIKQSEIELMKEKDI